MPRSLFLQALSLSPYIQSLSLFSISSPFTYSQFVAFFVFLARWISLCHSLSPLARNFFVTHRLLQLLLISHNYFKTILARPPYHPSQPPLCTPYSLLPPLATLTTIYNMVLIFHDIEKSVYVPVRSFPLTAYKEMIKISKEVITQKKWKTMQKRRKTACALQL